MGDESLKKFIALILSVMVIFTGATQLHLNASEYKTWKLCSSFAGFSLNSLASDMKGTDVAVGQCGTIMVSKKYSDWQSVSSSTYEILNNVIWDGKKFLAFGCNGTLVCSYDGLKWDKVKLAVQGDLCNAFIVNKCYFAQYRIRADKTPYVYNGYYSTDSTSLEDGILISNDGIQWSNIRLPKLLSKQFKLQKVIYFKNHYIAVLKNTSASCILTSENLSKWKSVQLPEDLQDIASTDTAAVVVGENVIMKTTDGVNWEKVYIEKSNTYRSLFDIKAIISVGNKFTLCGIHPLGGGPTSLLVANSTDAKKWVFNYIDNYDVQNGSLCNLIYANNQYNIIASDYQRLGNIFKWIMKSRDGVKWFNMPEIKQMPSVNCLIWDGKQYIACCDDGSIISSNDGDS